MKVSVEMLICSVCGMVISRDNFWSHVHDEYVFDD